MRAPERTVGFARQLASIMKEGASHMPTYRVRVTLGEAWCIHVDGTLDVLRVDRLMKVEPAARAWLARRHGMRPDAFGMDLHFDRAR
jgi:hypothetical protein